MPKWQNGTGNFNLIAKQVFSHTRTHRASLKRTVWILLPISAPLRWRLSRPFSLSLSLSQSLSLSLSLSLSIYVSLSLALFPSLSPPPPPLFLSPSLSLPSLSLPLSLSPSLSLPLSLSIFQSIYLSFCLCLCLSHRAHVTQKGDPPFAIAWTTKVMIVVNLPCL